MINVLIFKFPSYQNYTIKTYLFGFKIHKIRSSITFVGCRFNIELSRIVTITVPTIVLHLPFIVPKRQS